MLFFSLISKTGSSVCFLVSRLSKLSKSGSCILLFSVSSVKENLGFSPSVASDFFVSSLETGSGLV